MHSRASPPKRRSPWFAYLCCSLACVLQAEAGGQLNSLVVSLLIAAVGGDLVDDLVHSGHQILVALGDHDGLTEGGILCGEGKVGNLQTAVAGGHQRLTHSLIHHQAGNVAILNLQGKGGILFQLKELTVGEGGLDQLRLNGALLCADLLPRQGIPWWSRYLRCRS